jgi:signal transduction histidine kinase
LTAEQRGPIESIVRQSQMLTALVQDITLILATEAQTLRREPVSMDELVRAMVVDFRLPAERAGLTLQLEIGPDIPPVSGAPIYLRRVVDNLLDNAIKFTLAGGTVTVRLQCPGDQVTLQVADTGIGIPLEEQKHIFERFYQVDGTARRRHGGAGLGLALVKEIVDAYGGAVDVESRLGEGSTFTIMLPALKSS